MPSVYRPFLEKLGGSDATTFVGNEGEIFYDPTSNSLRRSDGTTPGGVALNSGGGGGSTPGLNEVTTVDANTVNQVTLTGGAKVGIITSLLPGAVIEVKDPINFEGTSSFANNVDIPTATLTVGAGSTRVIVGGATTSLIVEGDARITGILTIGTSSITFDPSDDSITATTFNGTATSAGSATSMSAGGNSIVGIDTTSVGQNALEFSSDNGSTSGVRWRITTDGHILPNGNSLYDLGSAEHKVRHLYLSNNTLYYEGEYLRVARHDNGGSAQPADKLISLSQLHNILNASTTFEEFKTALLLIDPTTP